MDDELLEWRWGIVGVMGQLILGFFCYLVWWIALCMDAFVGEEQIQEGRRWRRVVMEGNGFSFLSVVIYVPICPKLDGLFF